MIMCNLDERTSRLAGGFEMKAPCRVLYPIVKDKQKAHGVSKESQIKWTAQFVLR